MTYAEIASIWLRHYSDMRDNPALETWSNDQLSEIAIDYAIGETGEVCALPWLEQYAAEHA